jgi:L-asparaginase
MQKRVDGGNMTTEAAVTKLYYLFICDLTKDQIRAKMEQNLCGERS